MSPTTKPIGVAIAGLGFGEKVHLKALCTNEAFQPISIWHPRKDRLDECAKNNNLEGQTDFSEIINDKRIEGIIIATPPEPRYSLAINALKAGKHLLLEKPVALNAGQVADIQRLAMQKKLQVAVDFEYRAVPQFMQAKKILLAGEIGLPWLVKLDWIMSSRASNSRPWNWYSNKELGGGVIGALGTHAFDIVHWLIGPTKSVSAITSTSIKTRVDKSSGIERNVTSEDIALTQLEVEYPGLNAPLPVQVNLSSVSKEGRGCWLEIYGSNGTLLLGSDNQKDYVHGFGLWLATNGEKLKSVTTDNDLIFPKTWTDGRVAPVNRLQDWWAKSIRNSEPIIPGLTEGYFSQLVCDKAIESSETGLKIEI